MGIRRGPNIIQSGLVLSLDAGNVRSYPGSGATWYDVSGNGNTATLTNGTTYTSDIKGTLYFDGTDDHLTLSSNINTRLSNTVTTISTLTYIRSVGPNGYAELYAVLSSNRTGIKWQTNGIGMDANADFYNVFVNVSNAYNQWMDITCVVDRGSNVFKVYKNGTYIGQDTFTPYTANSTNITIGANSLTGNGGDYLKGSISAVKIYNRELSASEILQNFNMTKSRFGL